jgi:hypothetical protein
MRIIAFGCSYTYGHGLNDCLDDNGQPGPTASKLAFPSLVAKKLDFECVNLGKSGNSNKEIWNDILNFEFQKDDIAIITWTYYSRFCIIKSDSIRRINPWIEKERLYYMNYSNRNDMILDFYGRLNHTNFYLNNIDIKNYNFIIEDSECVPWNKTKILGLFKDIDKADDNCHPGILSHNKFADEIYRKIIKDF